MAGVSASGADEAEPAKRAAEPVPVSGADGAAGRGDDGGAVLVLRQIGLSLQNRISRPTGWILALLALVCLQLASARPGSPPSGYGSWQFVGGWLWNGGHAFAYGIVALLASLGLPRRANWPVLEGRAIRAIVLGVLVAGILDELHQSTVPLRNFSMLDILTDFVGAYFTLAVIAYVGRTDAGAAGLRSRIGLGAAASLAAALLATLGDRIADSIAWL